MEREELDTFLFRVVYFLHTCRHLFFGTTVDDHRTLGTQTFRGTDSIHGGVTTTDDGYVLTIEKRCVSSRIGSVHEVDTRQVFIAGEHTVEVLTRDIHETRQTGSRTHEDTFEALLLQFFDRDGLADDGVCMELHAKGAETVNLNIYNAVR